MATFNDLPFEIRAMIWKATVEPRTVEVRVLFDETAPDRTRKVSHMFSPTPVPAPLQTCREARSLGLYRKAFAEVEIAAACCHPDNPREYKLDEAAAFTDGAEWRYVWLNLEIDIVSIGPSELYWFEVALSIRRLKLERETCSEFYEWEIDGLCGFVNVEEVYIVCTSGMEMWHGTTDDQMWYGTMEDYSWPCKLENLILIDPFDGRMMSAPEMERVFREKLSRRDAERQPEVLAQLRRMEVD
ncbi:hypothetical protein V496_08316 [Pseudogymnoascus sp. VKM F-4515 (FW-2607)]|nr:hypothetical protein V496_08316 [Pseudogymnoascus sp. VKM F-4515 (FW-2607)]